MNTLPADKGLKLFDINWKCRTAGPSPINNNERVEVFLLGCKKAAMGHECPGCFNSITWDSSKAEFSWNPIELADKIADYTSNRFITIGGGEPTDQIEKLIPFCKRLKGYGFHILMYTWKTLKIDGNKYTLEQDIFDYDYILDTKYMSELANYIDIIIDGEFKAKEKLYINNYDDGLYGSVGSGNQRIIDINNNQYKYMSELKSIYLDTNNVLKFICQ